MNTTRLNATNKVINKLGVHKDVASRIEDIVYKKACSAGIKYRVSKKFTDKIFMKTYNNILFHYLVNLSKDSMKQYLTLENIESVRNMKYYEMDIESWTDYIKYEENEFKSIIDGKKVSLTTEFTCGKCKGNLTYYYESQTRSCDEGMTLDITCYYCDHSWKHFN